ncbi:MAG: hypothetical protein KDE33_00630 [Bacteroidetes bacterium]|nr:hypothetical protein [Bacteroidota bacterium]MCB9222466.1 hypothetical protein [Ignavibacteria bacterium]
MAKCDYCQGQIVGGEYYSIDMWGQKYHTHHHFTANSTCSCCQGLLIPGKDFLSIGVNTKICFYCKSEAILTWSQFQKCIRAVSDFYMMGEIYLPSDKVEYELKEMEELPTGVRGQVVFNGQNYKVQMARGLSKTVFCGILTHELMHIVLIERGFDFSHQETEGLCELASFFAYQFMSNHVSNEWIERMKKSPDPVYGEGFRIMMNRVKPYGSLQNFLNSVKK